nr:MAG TPA: hypothetical protein [Caudoviricetes sp.]
MKHEFWCKDKHFERKRLNVCHKFSFQRVERIRINNEPGNVSRQLGGSWNVWRFDSAFLHH